MSVYTLTEMFEKSRLYVIIILRFETIQRKSVFRRVIYSTKYAFFFYSELFSFSPYTSKKLSRIINYKYNYTHTADHQRFSYSIDRYISLTLFLLFDSPPEPPTQPSDSEYPESYLPHNFLVLPVSDE